MRRTHNYRLFVQNHATLKSRSQCHHIETGCEPASSKMDSGYCSCPAFMNWRLFRSVLEHVAEISVKDPLKV